MAANKTQLIDALTAATGLAAANVEAVVNALPEAIGKTLKDHGITGPGAFQLNCADGFDFSLVRSATPFPQWRLSVVASTGALADLGDNSDRFGLLVVNA